MRCPWCGHSLNPCPVGRITIDVCEKYAATWFDQGELVGVLHPVGPDPVALAQAPRPTGQEWPPSRARRDRPAAAPVELFLAVHALRPADASPDE